MKNSWESYGATHRGNRLLTARVANDGARMKITSLASSGEGLDGDTLDSGRLFFGVDERLAITKKVELKKNSSIEAVALVKFEMEQALLENSENYYFDFLPLVDSGHRRFLSIAYHKQKIDDIMADYTRLLRKPSGFRLDAVALATGYLKFCRLERGDLQILLDIDSDAVVITILFRQSLRAIDRLPLASGNEITFSEARRMATDLRLMVDFHLTELFREGITVPPSQIILSGRYAGDQSIIDSLKEKFTTEISTSHINEGYFESEPDMNRLAPANRFLIPLGLAVE